jgi:Mor family transcriptional regulator
MSESLDRYMKITEHRNQAAIHTMRLEIEVAEAHEAGESVAELARWAGVTRPTVYKMIERGNQNRRHMADPGSGP